MVFDTPVPRVYSDPHPALLQDSIRIALDGPNRELTVLTPADAPSPEPWSSSDYAPDVAGDRVVFTTPRHSCEVRKFYEIASVNLDGSGYKRLTHADGSDIIPTWSPDGSLIAFVSNRFAYEGSKETHPANRGDFNYYVMDADGSNVSSLAPDIFVSSGSYPPPPPVWSPRGELAFRDWNTKTLYTVRPEEPGVVTVLGQTNADPAWSPDGEWLAWMDSAAESILVARADGTEARSVLQLSAVDGFVGYPHQYFPAVLSWTRDGLGLRFILTTEEVLLGGQSALEPRYTISA